MSGDAWSFAYAFRRAGPCWECPFDPADGFRYTADGTPACVHPNKIGVEPDRIAPAPKPLPSAEPEATP
ncbi:hypothetical protein ABZ667_41790 [Streptomyces lavendulae]|uniref:hypothetical protein n=1 Tax=Streptomyces lavendulae TaxID=1914 RepID=UPI0033D4B71B